MLYITLESFILFFIFADGLCLVCLQQEREVQPNYSMYSSSFSFIIVTERVRANQWLPVYGLYTTKILVNTLLIISLQILQALQGGLVMDFIIFPSEPPFLVWALNIWQPFTALLYISMLFLKPCYGAQVSAQVNMASNVSYIYCSRWQLSIFRRPWFGRKKLSLWLIRLFSYLLTSPCSFFLSFFFSEIRFLVFYVILTENCLFLV